MATFVPGEFPASTDSAIRKPEDVLRSSRRERNRKRNGSMMIIVVL